MNPATDTIFLTDRFMGPDQSANGGYTCGILANAIGTAAQVTLRRPPPLNQPLEVRPMTPTGVALMHDGRVIAQAVAATVSRDVQKPVSFETAAQTSKAYTGFVSHPFERCFVCGPARGVGDGLRIFPTRYGDQLFIAPWIPDGTLADQAGTVGREFVWAALDCPGGWATLLEPPIEKLVVLGRLTAALHLEVRAGEHYVTIGWSIGSSGRKFHTGSAVYTAEGELCANAWATWIQIGGARENADPRASLSVADIQNRVEVDGR